MYHKMSSSPHFKQALAGGRSYGDATAVPSVPVQSCKRDPQPASTEARMGEGFTQGLLCSSFLGLLCFFGRGL